MNTRNTKINPRENKDVSIKLEDDPFQKILAKLEQKDEDIHDLKLEILSLTDQGKWGNNSHTGQPTTLFIRSISTYQGSMVKVIKTRFNGLAKSKKYFEMYNIYGDDDKLNVAAIYMAKTACD